MLGCGTYFADRASYSSQGYQYATAEGRHQLILADVLIGAHSAFRFAWSCLRSCKILSVQLREIALVAFADLGYGWRKLIGYLSCLETFLQLHRITCMDTVFHGVYIRCGTSVQVLTAQAATPRHGRRNSRQRTRGTHTLHRKLCRTRATAQQPAAQATASMLSSARVPRARTSGGS